MEAFLIFPHQLFENNPHLKKGRKIYLIEEHLFFRHYAFHKQKLVFQRAAMKQYELFLTSKGLEVNYVQSDLAESDIRNLIPQLEVQSVHCFDPVDNYLGRRIKEGCRSAEIDLQMHESLAFMNANKDLESFFKPDKKKFFQTEFYIQQRKRFKILIDNSGNPIGGKWSFDAENRKKYPANRTPPYIQFPNSDEYFKEAHQYIERHFPNNPGEVTEPLYPTTFDDARSWLQQFLTQRFIGFGDYEDAIVGDQSILHHSVLSPLINIGLLTPDYVVDEILGFADQNNIPINNTEGIIRQIIGWREFIRGVYVVKGTQERATNFWGFKRKIPISFYEGSTGILPIDVTIKKLLKTGYNHHIERLMVLGNFMLLCEFDPNEVYRWFMEMYIDAYDWVMVPNIYGMSQFADGGLMSTKPYISGSNYLMKMSDFKKGEWQLIWDGLFWRFMHAHRDFFLGNPRLGMLVKMFDKMPHQKQQDHLQVAEDYLSRLE